MNFFQKKNNLNPNLELKKIEIENIIPYFLITKFPLAVSSPNST